MCSADFAITDLSVPKIVYENSNFDVNIFVANTGSASANVDLDIELYRPNVPVLIFNKNGNSIPGNSIGIVNFEFINVNTNFSNSQYIIRAVITNEDPVSGKAINNTITKYFVVSRAQRKTPIPDMPIFFGLIVGVFIGVLFLSSKKNINGTNK